MAVPRSPAITDINVTPMIDVLLVLLIIFMVLHSQRMALTLQVPPSGDPGVPDYPHYPQIVVELTASGALAINDEPVAAEALANRLRSALGTRTVKLVYVKADAERAYQEVIGVVDAVRGAGADLVSFTPP